MSGLSDFSRIRSSNPQPGREDWVWVMLDGTKRQCGAGTQAQLFIDDTGVETVDDQGIAEGEGVHDAYIAHDESNGYDYVITLGHKYHVNGTAVSDRLRLRVNDAKPLTTPEADRIPDGAQIN